MIEASLSLYYSIITSMFSVQLFVLFCVVPLHSLWYWFTAGLRLCTVSSAVRLLPIAVFAYCCFNCGDCLPLFSESNSSKFYSCDWRKASGTHITMPCQLCSKPVFIISMKTNGRKSNKVNVGAWRDLLQRS